MTSEPRTRTLRQAGNLLVAIFMRGLAVVLPIALTAAVLVWFVSATEEFLGDIFRTVLPDLPYWPGLGIILAIGLIFGVGVLVTARVAQLLLGGADSLLAQIPLVKTIYISLRDISGLISG